MTQREGKKREDSKVITAGDPHKHSDYAGIITVETVDNDGAHLYSFGDGLFGELGNDSVMVHGTPQTVLFPTVQKYGACVCACARVCEQGRLYELIFSYFH